MSGSRKLQPGGVDLEGGVQEQPFEPGLFLAPRLASDGRRFLERTRIDVIVNWLPEMRRRTR